MYKTAAMISSVCLMFFFSDPPSADGQDINPGQWKFTATLTMPMMPKPQTLSHVKCYTQEDVQQDPLTAMLEEGPCQLTRSEVQGNRMDFEVDCQGDMGVTSRGKGYFIADGNSASGKMEVTIDVPNMPDTGGQDMKMIQEWKGRRIGACD